MLLCLCLKHDCHKANSIVTPVLHREGTGFLALWQRGACTGKLSCSGHWERPAGRGWGGGLTPNTEVIQLCLFSTHCPTRSCVLLRDSGSLDSLCHHEIQVHSKPVYTYINVPLKSNFMKRIPNPY